MGEVLAGLSLMLEDDFLQAAMPLLEGGEVEALEWSFDTTWESGMPAWAELLLGEFSDAGRLFGHGVHYSVLSGAWTARQESWLACLRMELQTRRYQHISEHFGFMSAGDFHQGAPLPVPLTDKTLRLGQERMKQLAREMDCPLGLENLALALCGADVRDQGEFLRKLLEPVDGFLVLDLHNVYCQMENFHCGAEEILSSYPLERVREMHISGGSWQEAQSGRGHPIRRDTHDDDVPETVFALLRQALPRCPQTRVVIFERLGNTLADPSARQRMRADFLRMKSIIAGDES